MILMRQVRRADGVCSIRRSCILRLQAPPHIVDLSRISERLQCVGKDNLLDNVRNGADGRRTDTSDQKPVKNTYADITREKEFSVSLLRV
jgi:hypothetical protein